MQTVLFSSCKTHPGHSAMWKHSLHPPALRPDLLSGFPGRWCIGYPHPGRLPDKGCGSLNVWRHRPLPGLFPFHCLPYDPTHRHYPAACHVIITAASTWNAYCILEFSETGFPHWVLPFLDIHFCMHSSIWRISCLIFLVFVMLRSLYSHFQRLSIGVF